MGQVIFYLAAALVLAGAVLVLVMPNPLRAAMSLIVALGGLSVVYLLLSAQFVAVMQLLVYAGAIMVLFVFVIMLLNVQDPGGSKRGVGTAAIVAAVMVMLSWAAARFIGAPSALTPRVATLPADFGSVEQVGTIILSDLVLPFEMLSVLLLVAIVGAVVIAKKRL